MATYFVMAIFFILFPWYETLKMTTIFCLCLVSLYQLFLQPSSHELRMQPFYRGARSSTLIHSGHASRGNREKGVSEEWGRVRCCGGAGWKYILPPFGLAVLHAHWRLQILIFYKLSRLVLLSKLIIYNIAILKSWVTSSYIQFWLWPRILS